MALIIKILLSALLIGTLVTLLHLQRDRLSAARNEVNDARQAIQERDDTIRTLKTVAVAHKKSLTRLEADRQRIAGTLAARETFIESLQHDNATLRHWADTALPDAIIRLRERAAVTGADADLQSLPASNTLPPAGSSPKD